jgi:hypothetical protein
MSPAALQLQSIGIQDLYLTKDPQINLFDYKYYRYVNFATETVKLPLNELATFNKKTSCTVPKRGHLLSKLFLHLKLPALQKESGTYLSWCDTLGYAIFSEPIELEIGGVVIDKLYPRFLDIWDEFTNSDKQLGKYLMLLKGDNYRSTMYNAEKEVDVIIPLDFWFTKQYSSALPLLSMYNQDIKLNFKFKDFSKLVNYDGGDPAPVVVLDSNVLAEYVFLDDSIAEKFQQQKHTYIIEQIQYNGDEIIPESNSVYNSSLKFNHAAKELFFAVAEKANVDSNNHFVYSSSIGDSNIVSEAALLLDGKKRFEYLPEIYYRNVFPDSVHSVIPMKYVYCMPFSVRPEHNQPTGSINLSRFNDVVLSLKLTPGNNECYLYVYALSYNVITIENGTFTMEFAV